MHSICLDKLFKDTPQLRAGTPISYDKSFVIVPENITSVNFLKKK